jgi:3-hydroxyacyl-CoA dehydrogenase
VVQAMIDKGHLGMKTKHGMWEWDDDGIKKEKGRIEKVLQQALEILNADMKK